jgi:hypothetical protein
MARPLKLGAAKESKYEY